LLSAAFSDALGRGRAAPGPAGRCLLYAQTAKMRISRRTTNAAAMPTIRMMFMLMAAAELEPGRCCW